MVCIAVEALPTISKPSAAVGVGISTSDRHVSGAAVLFLSIKTSSLPERVGGLAVMSEVVKLVGPASTLSAEENLTVMY